MAATWSFETIKSFPHIPYEDLFRRFERALLSLDLEIIKSDASSGLIEARKRGRWPLKSGQDIFVTVGSNAKVTVIEKVSMGSSILSGKASTDDMLTGKLIAAVKEMS